jgi:hypothetical protein
MLPAYDEFIISYKDRTPVLQFENHRKAVSNNGVFRPVIVVNGSVTGTWRRKTIKGKVNVETQFFYPPEKEIKNGFKRATHSFEEFLQKVVTIVTD